MKHTVKITLVLIAMFFIAQLIGIAVINLYSPTEIPGNISNETIKQYNLPYGMNPPQDTTPQSSLMSIVIAIAVGVILILILMKIKAEIFLRVWFFLVIILALGIAINSVLQGVKYGSLIAVIIALPLAIYKVFKRNILVHNITEILIYPGIAVIIAPLLNLWTVVVLLVLISIYDIYAVWHAKFMQKMATYQIQKVRVFSGFFIPYVRKEDKALIAKLKKSKNKNKKVKVSVAILGGGDVVFPIILAGVVLMAFGFLAALIIAIGATIALAGLFYYSEKGRFYPAMPFISSGCLIALGIVFLLKFINLI